MKSALDWANSDSLTNAPMAVPERNICLLKTNSLCSFYLVKLTERTAKA